MLRQLVENARPSNVAGTSSVRRFWIIQGLVIGVTVLHFTIERAEADGRLEGFLEGLRHFPVEAYVAPVVVAGLWFGIRGSVMTGLLATALSVPNLWIYHGQDYTWLGELVSSTFVVSVGVMVAWFIDGERRSRRLAQQSNRRLETRNLVTAAIAGETHADAAVRATLWALTASATVGAASFRPAGDESGLSAVLVGDPESGSEISAAFAAAAGRNGSEGQSGVGGVRIFPVEIAQSHFGYLAVARGDQEMAGEDLRLLGTVVSDLAVGLEKLRLEELERTDLHRYAQAVTVAQENERKRLARELHDGPAQSLIVLSRSLERMAGNQGISEEAAAQILEMQETTRHTLDTIRRASRALRPALLDDLGLVPALEALVDRHEQRVEGDVEYQVTGEPRRLPADVELAAFRIVQEALANIRRHAGARLTSVSIDFGEDAVRLKIADDGCGFDKKQLEGRGSLGVTGMRERAELIGAKLKLRTAPSAGTTVRMKVPNSSVGVRAL